MCFTHNLNYTKLKDELEETKKLVKEKDATIIKLSDIRDRLESEIRELTASLFEQAYSMVNQAKEETAQSQKLLKEANGKIEVLEAELKALKALVINSTPNSPNLKQQLKISIDANLLSNKPRNLLPVKTPSSTESATSRIFKSHKRTPSYNDVQFKQLAQLNNFLDSHSLSNNQTSSPIASNFCADGDSNNDLASIIKCEIYEIDPVYFKEIVMWRETPSFDSSNLFLTRVHCEDILPCISFKNRELSQELLTAIQANCVCIEDISSKQTEDDAMQICSLSNIPSVCQYKIKLSESSMQNYLISKLCRNRIISVCDFFTYLRYIKDGLVKSENRDIYWNIIRLRKRMALSRLGL